MFLLSFSQRETTLLLPILFPARLSPNGVISYRTAHAPKEEPLRGAPVAQ